MSHFVKSGTRLVALLIISTLFVACAKVADNSDALPLAKVYDLETRNQYNELIDGGYNQLAAGYADSSIALFLASDELIPEAKYTEYNIACVYGRQGETDKAFEWLQKMADLGWDLPDQLYEDSDFSSLLNDERFEKIVEQCRANVEAKQPAFAKRLQEIEIAPITFTTEEEYTEWVTTESNKIRRHSSIWYDWQHMAAQIDFAARRLAVLREMKKSDPEFDYELERVRAVSLLKSPYECWGTVSQMVSSEVDAYLSEATSASGISEANFFGGLAFTLEYCDSSNTKRVTSLQRSNAYLTNVLDETEYYGPAQTLKIANNLELSNGAKDQYRDEVRETLTAYAGDKWVNRIVSTRFKDDAIKMLWPIEFGLNDIDNKSIKISDYKGKALLIDFWATWCGPCLAELPNVKRVYEKYHDQGFEIVSISLDYESRKPLDDYRTWIKENGMTWRHIYDGKGWGAEVAGKYFIGSIPTAFLIGPDGNIAGESEDCYGESLEKTVKSALGI